jgi:hypothetical protein
MQELQYENIRFKVLVLNDTPYRQKLLVPYARYVIAQTKPTRKRIVNGARVVNTRGSPVASDNLLMFSAVCKPH